MAERSTKPYLIRAIHEWCADSGYTPYLSVKVDENTRVPAEFVKNGEIVLNLSYDATHKLTIGNDMVQFSARFGEEDLLFRLAGQLERAHPWFHKLPPAPYRSL